MKLSIAERIGILAVFMVVLTAMVVGVTFYQSSKQLLIDHALQRFSDEVSLEGLRIQEYIQALRDDTRLLSEVPPVRGLLQASQAGGRQMPGETTAGQWERRLQTIFSAMLRTRPEYVSARLIDVAGVERVRVDRVAGRIVVVGRDELQDKSARQYVVETLALPAGEIYLSEFDLNREFGKLVEPHQEVLRSAIPVYDDSGSQLAGMVVLTLDIGKTLRELRSGIADHGHEIFITNDRGDYLLHPNPGWSYGFDLGQRFRVQEDHPSTAVLFEPGTAVSEVVLLPENTRTQQAMVYARFAIDPYRPERFIAIGIAQPYDRIVAGVGEVLNRMLGGASMLVLLAVVLSILLSSRLSRPIKQMTRVVREYADGKQTTAQLPVERGDEIGLLARTFRAMALQTDEARTRLHEANQNLESMVENRTRALQRSEQRQRIIVENMVEGLITIDEQGSIQDFNRAAEELFGYTAKQVIGRNVSLLMPEPHAAAHDGYLKAYREGGTANIIGRAREVEGKRSDGGVFPMELAVNEFCLDEQRLFIGSARDITERKQMDRMKNEFISTVSHELRTPLTSIRGSLGLLLGGAAGDLPQRAKELLEIAGNNSERLLLLINDILDIQKIESGKLEFCFEIVPVMPFLQQAVAEHAAYGEQYGVTFELGQARENARIHADKARLMQVMGNLLSNAAKFSPAGSRVGISVSRRDDGTVRISVTDTGPGIPEHFMDELFTRFTQSDSSDTREKGGTGLGLAITRAIVERLGGHIGVVSDVGVGSTFYVELPEVVLT